MSDFDNLLSRALSTPRIDAPPKPPLALQRTCVGRAAPFVASLPVHVLVCTPDASSALTQACIASMKATTAGVKYTLNIEDNCRAADFSHPRVINKWLDRIGEAYLVICDNDVEFTPGWLDAALEYAETNQDVGVVGFTLYDSETVIWGSGMDVLSDGTVVPDPQHYTEPRQQISQCSACFLIAPTSVRCCEEYKKYRFEVAFCLELFEQGKKTVVLPNKLIHRRGADFMTLTDHEARRQITKHDRELFTRDWLETGRLQAARDRLRAINAPEIIVTEKRALVTVAIGDGYKDTLPLLERAARQWGADFFCVDESWQKPGELPHHLKWKCNLLFEMGYERICWADTDAIFVPDCPNIFDAVPNGTLGVFDEAPLLFHHKIDRADTCKEFVQDWGEHWGDPPDYEYPGYYFNSGIMVFDEATNPFVPRADGVYCFEGDALKDQTYLNIVATDIPKTMLDWRWNRMGIEGAHVALKSKDMLKGAYIAHYCGQTPIKKRLKVDLAKVLPNFAERSTPALVNGLRQMCKAIGPINKMVEVGSAHGAGAWYFTEAWPGVALTCVDSYQGERYQEAKHDFRRVFQRLPNVELWEMSSAQAAPLIPDHSLDFAYIDAAHDYKSVLADGTAWLPKVRPGGWIGGHDYKRQWPGCMQAVNELFGGPDLVFEDSSWLVRL